MRINFFYGLIFLLAAIVLQSALAFDGIFFELSFAILIVSALFLDFPELLFLVLLDIFIMNWQPAPSREIIITALYPLAVFFLRSAAQFSRWSMGAIAVFIGLIFLYVAAPEPAALLELRNFTIDFVGCMIFSTVLLLEWQKRSATI